MAENGGQNTDCEVFMIYIDISKDRNINIQYDIRYYNSIETTTAVLLFTVVVPGTNYWKCTETTFVTFHLLLRLYVLYHDLFVVRLLLLHEGGHGPDLRHHGTAAVPGRQGPRA